MSLKSNTGASEVEEDAHIERIWPTLSTLDEFLEKYLDHSQRYDFAKPFVEGKQIADIACGAGYGSYLLADVAKSVTGFDVADDALRHARQHFSRDNVEFRHASTIGVDEFDVVISFETLEHMDEKDGDDFLQRLRGSLRPAGVLVISTPINRTRHRVNVTPFHLREYNEEEFVAKLQGNGFGIDRIYGQCSSITEAFAKPVLGSLSVASIIKSGAHKVIPSRIRQYILRMLYANIERDSSRSNWIVPDDLSRAGVQIAICRRA